MKLQDKIIIKRQLINNFWLRSLKGSDHSEDLSIDGRIILS
jgi:hypothetical protein